MNQADFKNNLRKLEFPLCAIEALPKIENIVDNMSRSKQNFAMTLISEFIFLEKFKDTDFRKNANAVPFLTSQMTSIQEFQLILVLIEFFSRPGPDATRNAVFLSLFGGNLTPNRSSVLCKLISTSVSGSVSAVLCAAGTWMQQLGCTSAPSLEIAQNLVKDFVTFAKKTSEQLKQLPLVAPRFAANIMTAVADLYMNDQRGAFISPPDMLLDVFTEWVTDNPSLCLASQQPLALPSGAIAMPVITPIAGLIKWTVLAPIVNNKPTYSDLHLALLQTLLQIVPTAPPTALNAQHLLLIVSPLKSYADKLLSENLKPEDDANLQKSLERFSQSIQVALTAKCVYGNITQLLCNLETLPQNSLMDIVIKVNKNSA